MNIPPEEVNSDIASLVAVVQTLSSDAQISISPALIDINNKLNRRNRILDLIKDALAQLRLDMKYLIFDLESTRRERDALMEDAGK